MRLKMFGAICAALVAVAPVGADEVVRQYSLWLVPSGYQFERLQALVWDLAKEHGSPRYVPHVTAVGELSGTLTQIGRQAQELADHTHPLEAVMTTVAWSKDDYWMSFYMPILPTPPFHRFYDERHCRLPESLGTVRTWLASPAWREIMRKAQETLARIAT